uniref:Insulin-like domain-containing protein n=1 Tax=Octopus bimaculoides TaxID=37653 RepID=A0A0L8GK08_OCTBM
MCVSVIFRRVFNGIVDGYEVSPYASRGLRHRSSTLKDIIISKKKAKSYLVKRDRNWSGIVCECCYNTCTIEELLDYCKDPRDFRARLQQS